MKRRLVIRVLLLLILASCQRPLKVVAPVETPSPVLTAIDSLMWQQPDSALVQLLAYLDDSCCSADSDRHFAHVLLAELFYKNYYPQENHEELLQAVEYYDSIMAGTGWASTRGVSLRDIFISARAHYINGVGHYETDSVLDACQEYMKAVETMEGWFDEKDLRINLKQFKQFNQQSFKQLKIQTK